MNQTVQLLRRCLLATLLAGVAYFVSAEARAASAQGLQHIQKRDTVVQRKLTPEVSEMRSRMMSSALPVDIRQQGRHLCVTSRGNQLLPVYRTNGTLYTAFRISKGTNWLSGLPKGAYYINNRRFTIN